MIPQIHRARGGCEDHGTGHEVFRWRSRKLLLGGGNLRDGPIIRGFHANSIELRYVRDIRSRPSKSHRHRRGERGGHRASPRSLHRRTCQSPCSPWKTHRREPIPSPRVPQPRRLGRVFHSRNKRRRALRSPSRAGRLESGSPDRPREGEGVRAHGPVKRSIPRGLRPIGCSGHRPAPSHTGIRSRQPSAGRTFFRP